MQLRRLLTLVLAVSGAAACVRPPAADPVILSLDGEDVHRSEFDHRLAELARRSEFEPGSAEVKADASLRQAMLGPFLEERVLVLEARRRGLVKAGAATDDERSAVETLLKRSVSASDVADTEIADYYQSHADEFRRPETLTLRQILVPTENEARDVRRRLQGDPKAFELLARTRSRSPEAASGGLVGTFERGQLPSELDAAAFALVAGATSDIVRSPLGFHVLRVEARTPAREESLEDAKPEIRDRLARDKTEQAVHAFVQQLLSRAKVNHEVALAAPRRS